jgi:tetratricopeptide (TPR) repeat protein
LAQPPAVRFDGLGSHSWPISTRSADAQAFFDQGLAFLYEFNHDEAIRSFRQAALLDPQCPMPHWGIALAIAEQMLAGEILYREGRTDDAIAALRDAVEREDALRYIEPPD